MRRKRRDRRGLRKRIFGLDKLVAIYTMVFTGILSFGILLVVVVLFLLYGMSDIKRQDRQEIRFYLESIDRRALKKIVDRTKAAYEKVADDYPDEAFTSGEDNPLGNEEFVRRIIPIMDKDYLDIQKKLAACKHVSHMVNIDIVFYDEKRNRLVIVVDGESIDRKTFFYPGEWISAGDIGIFSKNQLARYGRSPLLKERDRVVGKGQFISDYYPLQKVIGDSNSYIIVDWEVSFLIDHVKIFSRIAIPIILLLISLYAFISVKLLHRQIVNPLMEIGDAAEEYSMLEAEELETADPVFEGVSVDSVKEIRDLLKAMQHMEQNLSENMRQLKLTTAKRERVETELSVARTIQMSFLPRVTAEIADSDRVDIFGIMNPAREVGGDFYDFFLSDPGHLVFLVGDVSDKGAGAAMFMATCLSMLRMRAMMGGTPAEILAATDQMIMERNSQGMFVTVWIGVLDIQSGHLLSANAGHEYPAILRREADSDDRAFGICKGAHGMPLAFWPENPFPQEEMVLQSGDKIILFTDGVTEAENTEGDMFGYDRMLDVLNKHKNEDITTICESLHQKVREYAGGAEQFDDLTILGLEVL